MDNLPFVLFHVRNEDCHILGHQIFTSLNNKVQHAINKGTVRGKLVDMADAPVVVGLPNDGEIGPVAESHVVGLSRENCGTPRDFCFPNEL
jgi:hypothetical protein